MEFSNDTTFVPFFTDVSIRGGWFYHPSQDDICKPGVPCSGVKSLTKLVEIYFQSVGRGSVLQLNIPPNRDGLLTNNDVTQLRRLGAYIRDTFSNDFDPSEAPARLACLLEWTDAPPHNGRTFGLI